MTGDNRDFSKDSRMVEVGPVSENSVSGKALVHDPYLGVAVDRHQPSLKSAAVTKRQTNQTQENCRTAFWTYCQTDGWIKVCTQAVHYRQRVKVSRSAKIALSEAILLCGLGEDCR